MPSFTTTRDAKDFLISKILEEANRTSVDLTDIERMMLYFTETEPSLPDIYEVSAAFDEQYDQSDYEQKIASIIRSYKSWAKGHDTAALAQWKAAVKMLERFEAEHLGKALSLQRRELRQQLDVGVSRLHLVRG